MKYDLTQMIKDRKIRNNSFAKIQFTWKTANECVENTLTSSYNFLSHA